MAKPLVSTTRSHKSIIVAVCLVTIIFNSFSAEKSQSSKVKVMVSDSVYVPTEFELKRAERLFYGLIPINPGVRACTECHVLSYTDTLSWNPSAFDIAHTFAGRDVREMMDVLNNPSGRKMQEVHRGYSVSEEQALLLQSYIEKLNLTGKPLKKIKLTRLFLFILANLIGAAATLDLIVTRKIRYKLVHLVLILGAAIYITRTIVNESINIGRQQNYAPLQPVKFSHLVHAGQNQIDCQYCHNIAETSKSAGIPSTSLCMNCHVLIVEGTRSGRFEIAKVRKAAESMTPLDWIKVHNLPDHVFFSHAQHVKAGKIDCMECHGLVEEMDVVYQYSDLSMGWCLECHRTRGVDFIDNEYYSIYEEFHKQITHGSRDSVLVRDIGGTNCMKCHY